jgi:hypothetical protein
MLFDHLGRFGRWRLRRRGPGFGSQMSSFRHAGSRLDRLQERASKRRAIAKDIMVELDLKKARRTQLYRHPPGGIAFAHGLHQAGNEVTWWDELKINAIEIA